MKKAVHAIRNLGMNVVMLCLAAAFALSSTGFQAPDRITRQQQRSRTQRQPRYRVCPGLSQEPSALHSVFHRGVKASDPPPTDVAATNHFAPEFIPVEIVRVHAPPGSVPSPHYAPALPRPPPLFA